MYQMSIRFDEDVMQKIILLMLQMQLMSVDLLVIQKRQIYLLHLKIIIMVLKHQMLT